MKNRWVPWALVALAAVPRLIGITWALPDETHFFSYHPDEFDTAGRVLQVLETGSWDPEFFAYGSFYLYLTTILAWPFHAAGLLETVTGAHLAARLVTVALAGGTVLLAWAIAARLRGPRTAVLTGVLVALAPGHVLHSHFATVDVTVTHRGLSRTLPSAFTFDPLNHPSNSATSLLPFSHVHPGKH